MNFIDIILLVPMIYFAWKGIKNGLIIEVFTLLALIVGLYAGIHFSDFLALKLKELFSWNSKYVPTICFTLIFLGVGAMVYFAGVTLKKLVKIVQLSAIDKIAGLVFSLLTCIYLLSTVLNILESYDQRSSFFPKEKKESSLLYKPITTISTSTIPGFSESLIFLNDSIVNQSDTLSKQ